MTKVKDITVGQIVSAPFKLIKKAWAKKKRKRDIDLENDRPGNLNPVESEVENAG